jgi:hypothetical protein
LGQLACAAPVPVVTLDCKAIRGPILSNGGYWLIINQLNSLGFSQKVPFKPIAAIGYCKYLFSLEFF